MMDEYDTCMASELRFRLKVGCGAQYVIVHGLRAVVRNKGRVWSPIYIYVIWLLRCGWRHSTEGRMANVHGRAGREP